MKCHDLQMKNHHLRMILPDLMVKSPKISQVLVLQRAARLRLPRLERTFWATIRRGAVPDRVAIPEVPRRSGEFGCDSYDIYPLVN